MSHTYDTTTFAIRPPTCPSEGLSAMPFTTYAYERSQIPGEPLVYTSGATRSGWAIYQTGFILEKLNLPALAFLTVDGAENLLRTEDGQHGYTHRQRPPAGSDRAVSCIFRAAESGAHAG
jgi:hypothetical protein